MFWSVPHRIMYVLYIFYCLFTNDSTLTLNRKGVGLFCTPNIDIGEEKQTRQRTDIPSPLAGASLSLGNKRPYEHQEVSEKEAERVL